MNRRHYLNWLVRHLGVTVGLSPLLVSEPSGEHMPSCVFAPCPCLCLHLSPSSPVASRKPGLPSLSSQWNRLESTMNNTGDLPQKNEIRISSASAWTLWVFHMGESPGDSPAHPGWELRLWVLSLCHWNSQLPGFLTLPISTAIAHPAVRDCRGSPDHYRQNMASEGS